MSDFSLTLVLQIKTSKIILSSVIDSHLGLRSKLIGYQYSEIIRAVFSVFCCGGDCMEDLNLYPKGMYIRNAIKRLMEML